MCIPTETRFARGNLAPLAALVLAGALTACASEEQSQDAGDWSGQTEFRNYVRSCWVFNTKATEDDRTVTIVMQMNPDKTLKRAEIDPADHGKMDDPDYRVLAESALRAVQKCGEGGKKFPIGDDLAYTEWSEIKARFQSSDLN